MFVWHAAEESGLQGSRFHADFPVVPLEKVQAVLNMDMVGRDDCDNLEGDYRNSVFVVGADRRAHKKTVVVGIENPKEAEIRSGVLVSQKVVVKGQEELPDGATVTVQTEGGENAEVEKKPAAEPKPAE